MKRLALVLAALAAVAVLASLAVVGIAEARRKSRVSSCAGNLMVLWNLQRTYTLTHGGPLKAMPDATGSDFWRALERTTPPLLDTDHWELLICAVKGDSRKGDVDYFGPGAPVHRLAGGDPVACDDPRNHGSEGANVLKKSGDVLEYSPADFDALFRTHPTPPRR